jgi:hypothetical protein
MSWDLAKSDHRPVTATIIWKEFVPAMHSRHRGDGPVRPASHPASSKPANARSRTWGKLGERSCIELSGAGSSRAWRALECEGASRDPLRSGAPHAHRGFGDPSELPRIRAAPWSSSLASVTNRSGLDLQCSCPDTVSRRAFKVYGPRDCVGVSAGT